MSNCLADGGLAPPPGCTIVEENSSHADGVEALYDKAFGPGRFARTAERLREGNTVMDGCSHVAVDEAGRVVAAVRIWPIDVGGQAGAVFVGPVAVDPDWRGGALGLCLVELCLERATEQGARAAILIGDAPYFERIGFATVRTRDYPAPGHVPEGRLLAKPLVEGGLDDLIGPLSVPRGASPA